MSIDPELALRIEHIAGPPHYASGVYPDVVRAQRVRIADVAAALCKPLRPQLIDVTRTHAARLDVREIVPLSCPLRLKPDPGCCTTTAPASCCEPVDKVGCCDATWTGSRGCGCH